MIFLAPESSTGDAFELFTHAGNSWNVQSSSAQPLRIATGCSTRRLLQLWYFVGGRMVEKYTPMFREGGSHPQEVIWEPARISGERQAKTYSPWIYPLCYVPATDDRSCLTLTCIRKLYFEKDAHADYTSCMLIWRGSVSAGAGRSATTRIALLRNEGSRSVSPVINLVLLYDQTQCCVFADWKVQITISLVKKNQASIAKVLAQAAECDKLIITTFSLLPRTNGSFIPWNWSTPLESYNDDDRFSSLLSK